MIDPSFAHPQSVARREAALSDSSRHGELGRSNGRRASHGGFAAVLLSMEGAALLATVSGHQGSLMQERQQSALYGEE